MASGPAHAAASILLSGPVGLAVAQGTGQAAWGLAAGLGSLSGVLLSPDLDMEILTYSERWFFRRRWLWLKLLGIPWTLLWWPYARLIPHRHPLSHLPVLGTALRLLYLWGVAGTALALLNGTLGWGGTAEPLLRLLEAPAFWMWALGLALSDALHWLMDGMPLRGVW